MVRVADGLGVDMETGRGWEDLLDKLPFRAQATHKPFGKIADPVA